MKFYSLCLIALSFKALHSDASPGGAPQTEDVCSNMLPRHGATVQTSPAPFELIASESNIKGGERLRITIRVTGSATFKGFLLQARTDESNEIVGEFYGISQSEPFNFRSCALRFHNCVTHANNNPKENITFEWKAPYGYEGSVYFIATVVQERITFWSNIQSQLINVTLSDENLPGFLNAQFYDDCGVKKTCFGVPENCVKSKNCEYLGSFKVDGGKYNFELKSPINAAWVGIGVSEDTLMGSDSVIECVKEGNFVNAYTSFTRRGTGNYGADRQLVDQNIISLKTSMIENGAIYCLVEREPSTQIEGIEFDLTTKQFYLLLATGNELKENSISYHGPTTRSISPKSISFNEDAYEVLGANEKSQLMITLHGSFMVVAWIGLTSIGIITARYFKTLLGDAKIAQSAVWFRIHQVCMSLTLLLTIAAITIIWIDVGQWRSSWHSIVGIITASLCFLQGFLSIFRPGPGDHARPVFNFMHGSVGKLTHFLSVITIFLATALESANLPAWTKYVVAAYIISYLIFYVIFMNLSLISNILHARDDSVEPKFVGVRRFLFGTFIVLVIGFTIAVVIAIAKL